MTYSLTRTSKEGWASILADIENSKHSIECELFIVGTDEIGRELLDALRKKSKQGVKVRLLIDAAGSYLLYLANDLKAELRADGIQLSFFNHFIPMYPRTLTLWYFRNHRRSIIIDEKVGYTGGICFGKEMEEWRETMVRIENDESVMDMQQAFNRNWKLSERKIFEKRIVPTQKDWVYVTNAPLPGRRYLYKEIIKLIKKSEKEIFLTTPYFVPDFIFARALLRAAKRGVKVHLLIPEHSDHRFVDHAGDFYKEKLIKHGVSIYRYTKSMIHTKTGIFDDTAFIGSMNLDNVSMHYNFEGGFVIKDRNCVAELREHFMEDVKDIEAITMSGWRARPLKEKVLMYITWPIRKLL